MARGGSSTATEATAACQTTIPKKSFFKSFQKKRQKPEKQQLAAWCISWPIDPKGLKYDSLKNGSRPITKPLALWTSAALVPMVLEQYQHWEPLLALWTSVALLAMVLGEQYQH